MRLIEIVPFMSLLFAVHDLTGAGLLVAGSRGGREEKEQDQPEDHANTSESDSPALTQCKWAMRNRVNDHRQLVIVTLAHP